MIKIITTEFWLILLTEIKYSNYMENNSICPLFDRCPIYQRNVFYNEKAGETYRTIYCLAGEVEYSTCKRYQVSIKLGRPVPDTIMPNSSLSVQQIIDRME